jgi:hypothetical protein
MIGSGSTRAGAAVALKHHLDSVFRHAQNPFDSGTGQALASSRGATIGGVLCVMNSLRSAGQIKPAGRRLTKGPVEFREDRVDLLKAKGK